MVDFLFMDLWATVYWSRITDHCSPYGGVGRGWGVGRGLGVTLGVAVGVGVADGLGVELGVGDTVGVVCWTRLGAISSASVEIMRAVCQCPPQTIISGPVQTAV